MQDIVLKAKAREAHGKALAQIRNDGFVPGIVYGQGKEATSVQIPAKELDTAFHQAGTNRLISLKIDDKRPVNTLFVDLQRDPVSNQTLHFDLYKVRMDEKIKTEVPIHFVGESVAEYDLGGVLLKSLEEIEVEALPANLPEGFEVDISVLEEIGQAIHVSDLKAPEGVTILDEEEAVIVKIDPPRSEEELEELDAEVETDEAAQVESEHGGDDETEEGAETAEGEDKEE